MIEAMDIDLPTEVGPTKDTVDALIEHLVGPLLPLKHTNIAKETPSESKQKTVAKQVHAATVLYNYYHLRHHRENQFLKFDQFCKLAALLKPSIQQHMKYTCQSDHTILNDPENQLSLTEKAIMDACTISETLLDASANISKIIKEWKITKVAVLLVDSKKENCFLQFNDGVWSIIEKELNPETKKRKKVMNESVEESEVGFQRLAFSAVKEVAGIAYGKLKVLESNLVYSLSQAKTATRFYILRSTQAISEDNLVPIQDVISSLQGPVVKECLGSWVITPVVEYYYLLPYAEIISKLFTSINVCRESYSSPHQVKEGRADVNIIPASQNSFQTERGEHKKVSDNVQKMSNFDSVIVQICNPSKEEPNENKVSSNKKESFETKKDSDNLRKRSKLDSEIVHISSSVKEEPHKVSKSAFESNQCSEKESGESKKASDNLQNNSKLDSGIVQDYIISKEEPYDSKVSKSTFKSNQCNEKESSVSKEIPNNLRKDSNLDSEFVNIINSVNEEPHESKVSKSTFKSNQCNEKESGVSKEVPDNLQKESNLDSELVDIFNPFNEEPHDSKVSKSTFKSNHCNEKESGASKEVPDNLQKESNLDSEIVDISNPVNEEPHDSKVSKNTFKFNHCNEKESGESNEVSDNLQEESNMDSEIFVIGYSVKEEPHDIKVSNSTYESDECSEKESDEMKEVSDELQKKSKLDSEVVDMAISVKEEPDDSEFSGNTYEPNQCSSAMEPVCEVADDVITSQSIARPVDPKVKETENSTGNSITVSNNDSKPEDMHGSCRAELQDPSSGANNNLTNDKLSICLHKENQDTKWQTPLKVYCRHVRRSTTDSIKNKANLKNLKETSSIRQSKDERVDGQCMVPADENRSLTVNYTLENFSSIVDAKKSELSDAALRALLNKRKKLHHQQQITEKELSLCDKKIQAIVHGGIGDCLGLKLEAVIDCCNEICKQDDMHTQQHSNLHVSRSLPSLSGKSLSEAQLTLRKACQELDDICLSNNWILPTYHTSRSDGGFVANVTVKGSNFECSGASGNQPSIDEARNSAATQVITNLQKMANGMNSATLVE